MQASKCSPAQEFQRRFFARLLLLFGKPALLPRVADFRRFRHIAEATGTDVSMGVLGLAGFARTGGGRFSDVNLNDQTFAPEPIGQTRLFRLRTLCRRFREAPAPDHRIVRRCCH